MTIEKGVRHAVALTNLDSTALSNESNESTAYVASDAICPMSQHGFTATYTECVARKVDTSASHPYPPSSLFFLFLSTAGVKHSPATGSKKARNQNNKEGASQPIESRRHDPAR